MNVTIKWGSSQFSQHPGPGPGLSAWQLSKGSVSDLATVRHRQTQHTGRARGATRNLNIRALTSENRYIFLSCIIEYSTCFFQEPLSPCRGSWTKPWYSVIVYSVVLWEWCSTCSTVSPGVKSPPAQPRDDKVCVECNFVFGKNQEGSLQWRQCQRMLPRLEISFLRRPVETFYPHYPLSNWSQGKYFDGITRRQGIWVDKWLGMLGINLTDYTGIGYQM